MINKRSEIDRWNRKSNRCQRNEMEIALERLPPPLPHSVLPAERKGPSIFLQNRGGAAEESGAEETEGRVASER